jgi:short-subunit dehydrogenase
MTLKQKYGQLAIVAGASEGIGAAYSTRLAKEGMDLILIARRKEPLEQLASSLTREYQVHVECIECDLSESGAAQQIKDAVLGREVNLLVYNAAIPYIGPFEKSSLEHHNRMAFANMVTPVSMVQLFAGPMLEKGRGAIILMSSLAGFQGSGFLTMYAATKAFNRVLGEGLWYEWKSRGVDVIACCAGATATPNYINSNPGKTGLFEPPVQHPEEVVKECFQNLGKRPSFISGGGNRLASFVMQKLLSRKMAINIMGETTRKMYWL